MRCIGPANLIATYAHSRCDAAPRNRRARSRAAFMKMPAMLPARSPAQWHSNNPAATESVSRCCLPISSASSGLAVSGCAARAGRKTSSRSRPSLRTYAASPSSSPDRHHSPWRALRKRRIHQYQCVEADAPLRAHGKQGYREPVNAPPSPGLLQRNRHGPTVPAAAEATSGIRGSPDPPQGSLGPAHGDRV